MKKSSYCHHTPIRKTAEFDDVARVLADTTTAALRSVSHFDDEHRLLIIDDDPIVLRALKHSLKRRVSKIYTATTDRTACTLLDKFPINIVVCDYDLGSRKRNGVALLRALKSEFPKIRRAILYTGVDIREVGNTSGIDAVLNKGTDLYKLRMLIQKPFD